MSDGAVTGVVEPIYCHIGHRTCEARLRMGLTQARLGELVGLTRTSIVNIELGRQRVMLHTVLVLAAALNVSASDLLGVDNISIREGDKVIDGLRSELTIARDAVAEARAKEKALEKRVAQLERTIRIIRTTASSVGS